MSTIVKPKEDIISYNNELENGDWGLVIPPSKNITNAFNKVYKDCLVNRIDSNTLLLISIEDGSMKVLLTNSETFLYYPISEVTINYKP